MRPRSRQLKVLSTAIDTDGNTTKSCLQGRVSGAFLKQKGSAGWWAGSESSARERSMGGMSEGKERTRYVFLDCTTFSLHCNA